MKLRTQICQMQRSLQMGFDIPAHLLNQGGVRDWNVCLRGMAPLAGTKSSGFGLCWPLKEGHLFATWSASRA